MAGGEPHPPQIPVKPLVLWFYSLGEVSGQSLGFISTKGSSAAGSHKTSIVQKQNPLEPRCMHCNQATGLISVLSLQFYKLRNRR